MACCTLTTSSRAHETRDLGLAADDSQQRQLANFQKWQVNDCGDTARYNEVLNGHPAHRTRVTFTSAEFTIAKCVICSMLRYPKHANLSVFDHLIRLSITTPDADFRFDLMSSSFLLSQRIRTNSEGLS